MKGLLNKIINEQNIKEFSALDLVTSRNITSGRNYHSNAVGGSSK